MKPEVLTMWRIELLHVAVVHFPIAILMLVAMLEWIVSGRRFVNKESLFLQKMEYVLLCVGTLSVWAAWFTGGLAEDVVNRVICDPTVTERHEDFALWTAWLFTAALLISTIAPRVKAAGKQKILSILQLIIITAGAVTLGLTSHLGASLIHQQGAAVYKPSETCEEFAE